MRTTFINTLTQMARQDKDIYLLTADMGFSVFEKFAEEFSERFINVGICEANMIGIAAGLAMSGKKVIVYSIIPFVTMRCFEQVRDDICYHNLNVKLVGVGGGLSYGSAGATHHAIEDIAIMRSLPNMKVICPADPYESENTIKQILSEEGPAYVRLNKNGEPLLYNKQQDFKIGKAIKLSEGADLSIISYGNMLEQAINVSSRLKDMGYSVKLIDMHTIKPIDKYTIKECINDTKAIFTLEEHNVIGGVGSAVAEVIAENISKPIIFKSYGIPDVYATCSGSSKYFRNIYGIDETSVINDIVQRMKNISSIL